MTNYRNYLCLSLTTNVMDMDMNESITRVVPTEYRMSGNKNLSFCLKLPYHQK